jgi:acyl carrier protein
MSDGVAWPAKYEDVLRQHLPLLDAGQQLHSGAVLVDLGLDSLGVIALLVDLEETFSVVIPDERLGQETFATAGSLWGVLAELYEGDG